MNKIAYILIILVAFKAIMGFHFPWEKCPCCGKRLDKNHKPLSATRQTEELERELDREIELNRKKKMENIEKNINEEFENWDKLWRKLDRIKKG